MEHITCDRCPSARAVALWVNIIDSIPVMLAFCSHHSQEHGVKLTFRGWIMSPLNYPAYAARHSAESAWADSA